MRPAISEFLITALNIILLASVLFLGLFGAMLFEYDTSHLTY